MKPPLISNHLTLPRTLVDLIDENAPKSRSQYIITLIEAFKQHKRETMDLSDFNDPEDKTSSFTLRVTPELNEVLASLCKRRYRTKNNMVLVICATQLIKLGLHRS